MADYHDYHQVWDDWAYWDQVDLENEMDAQLDAQLDAKSTVGRGRRPRRVVTDRMNPFTAMGDDEFVDRFRLRKASMYDLIEEIRDQLPAANDLRGCPVPPYLQTLIAIRCMATGDHQRTLGDSHDVSQTTVSECLKTVSRAIATKVIFL
ncbi:hypothetical protein GWK47_023346 [Chionoecetes opilio]|uniref:Nuclease HARBI1 n=1 Tax=Chionoecetes opilio TaxID=41210 RepID=A0A8J4XLW5_CHIOP|nr:hypothetical protein GWK47_023346 [Chionoecetes opilio]